MKIWGENDYGENTYRDLTAVFRSFHCSNITPENKL